MPFANEHAARITSPEYQRYTRKEIAPGISQVYGWNGNKGAVQAYRFAKAKFTAAEAKAWLKAHDVKWILFEPAKEGKAGENNDKTFQGGK